MDLVMALGAALSGVATVIGVVEVHRNQQVAQVKTSLSARGCIAASGVGMVALAAAVLGWHVAAATMASVGAVVVVSAVAVDHRTEAGSRPVHDIRRA